MNAQPFDSSSFDATVIGPPPGQESSSTGSPAAPRVELVSGTAPRLEAETQVLLRIRLRAAAIVLLSGVASFFLRSFFVEDAPARTAQMIVSAALVAAILALSSNRAMTLRQLRLLEFGIFAVVAIYLGDYGYQLVLRKAMLGNPVYAIAAIKSTVLYFFAVILLYGTFIPNTWQRAARVIVPLALAPIAVMGLLRMTSPAVQNVVGQFANFEQVSDNVIMMTLGAVASLYGTHIINTLRVEAFKARQMGQYHLKEQLGAGGMGEVYLAEHRLLKRPCAIKLIRPGSRADPAAIARFEREVRTTAKLSHWNTVNIFDYGRTDDGTFYYVMEYLPGLSLAELVRRHGPLPPARVIHLLRQACRALQEAHAAGLVHRDIKPANLFAARLGGVCDVAKLLDFGLVTHTADGQNGLLSQPGTVSGSPLYMAPEQAAAANEPDPRSDIYSLGATAYYLMTGKAPFDRKSVVELMIAHARDPVPPLAPLCPALPADLEQIVLKCLTKNPGERFQDAPSLEQALARCQDADRWTDADATRWWKEKEGT
jgi:serine/threonine-protein kinase